MIQREVLLGGIMDMLGHVFQIPSNWCPQGETVTKGQKGEVGLTGSTGQKGDNQDKRVMLRHRVIKDKKEMQDHKDHEYILTGDKGQKGEIGTKGD